MKTIRSWAPSCPGLSLLLVACGGGDDEHRRAWCRSRGSTAQQGHHRAIDGGTAASGLQPLSGAAKCDVDLRYLIYMTRDPAGAPARPPPACWCPQAPPRPALANVRWCFTRTAPRCRSKNMANVCSDSEGSLLMAVFAAQGFIVVAPNYLGYDRSSLAYHPYLHRRGPGRRHGRRPARREDAHRAESPTKAFGETADQGYSQGGHVAMATHKVIERDHSRSSPSPPRGRCRGRTTS